MYDSYYNIKSSRCKQKAGLFFEIPVRFHKKKKKEREKSYERLSD